MIMMPITLKEFFIGQKVYASGEFTAVTPLTPAGVVVHSPTLPTANQSALHSFSAGNCLQQGKSWNTNNANPNGACFTKCDYGYVKKCGKDIDMCRLDIITLDKAKFACIDKDGKWNDNTQECLKNCPNGYVEVCGDEQNECLQAGGNLGIDCKPDQLINGTCHRNINKTLGIRGSDTIPSPTILLQDIVLAATSFVGTLIMIALIVMGIKYVKGGYDESSTGDLKGNIKKLLIGLFLIIGSYTIIRLIQYVARGY